MAKKIEYNKVVKFDTIKEMMELSVALENLGISINDLDENIG